MADSVSPPKDALVLIKEALNAPSGVVPESLLRNLYRAFEAQPGTLPLLLPNVLPLFDRPEPVRTWVLNYMDLAFCRGVLTMDARRTRKFCLHSCPCYMLYYWTLLQYRF